MTDTQHWHLQTDQQGIAWLTLDRADRRVNTLNQQVLQEFDSMIKTISRGDYHALIIQSGKSSGFIAGADIHEIREAPEQQAINNLVRQGHEVFAELAKLKIPTVAMIDGFCLGGGFELALACQYRVAESAAQLGLPEIKLGLHPGWGGTVRLTKLIGAPKAMNLILTGRTVTAEKASKLGCVHYAVSRRQLERAAIYCARNKPRQRHPKLTEQLTNARWVRLLLAKRMRQQTQQVVKSEHYPSPFKVIENWVNHGVTAEAFLTEEHSFIGLTKQPECHQLIRAFFLREQLKELGKQTSYQPRYIHVIGAGVMGGDIAAWAVLNGFTVTLQDQSPELVAPAIKRAYELFQRKLKQPHQIQAAFDRLIGDTKGDGLARADLVIEAIAENLEAKQGLFEQIEPKLKRDAVLATNTSSLMLEDLAKSLSRPGRLIGLHFFNPVAKMQLVEVVQGQNSESEYVNRGTAWVRQIDRLPVTVKSGPGFLVNRVLFPYLLEGIRLYEESVPIQAIDQAGENFGMPMGPLKLADYVGLDILHDGLQTHASQFGVQVPNSLQKLVETGRLGKKTGRGYYRWRRNKPVTSSKQKHSTGGNGQIQSRLIDPMLNAAVACLREQVVESPDLLDAALIFGTGFAPFRGGPIQYIQHEGPSAIYQRLSKLAETRGERFKPDPGWDSWIEGAVDK